MKLSRVSTSIWFWIAFHIGVFIAIAIDLASFKRRHRALSMRAAARRSVLWVLLSLAFSLVVAQMQGLDRALDFLTGYLIEYSLSVDNIFVFVLIFAYFKVPPISQHRVLVWGIVGALVMRGVMIWLGVSLVSRFHFILYLFGVFLFITGIRMAFSKQQTDFGDSWFLRVCRKLMPVTHDFRGSHFTARVDGRLMLTPLTLVLLVIDVMDLVFAVDSIPSGVRHHARHVHRLYIEYLRDSRAAFPLFSARQSHESICLPPQRSLHHSGFCWSENDSLEAVSDSELHLTPRHNNGVGCDDLFVHFEDPEPTRRWIAKIGL